MASIPTWFDANFYMASKLAQMQATDPEGNWTAETLKAAFAENGFTGPASTLTRTTTLPPSWSR